MPISCRRRPSCELRVNRRDAERAINHEPHILRYTRWLAEHRGLHFDPTTQQAVSQKEDPDVPEGTVTDVFQKGYRLGDRVIRSAMVVVSTGGPSAEE